MIINKIVMDAIRSRVEGYKGSNQDCKDLLDYIDENIVPEKLTEAIARAVENGIDNAISQSSVISAVERAVENLKR